MLTQEEVKELLDYNPDTGVFVWKPRDNVRKTWNTRYAGTIAGSYDYEGYWRMAIHNRTQKAHRIAWLYVYGEFPSDQIDHINGVKHDNRIENLRVVSSKINHENKKKGKSNNKYSNLLGVTFCKKVKKWKAQITYDKKCHFIGFYDDPEDAHRAYLQAKIKHHIGYVPNETKA